MDKNNNHIEILQLSNYIRPDVKEVNNKEYVMNGDKNSFYNYIIDRYNGSPTNRAIIDSYSKFIYGKGLMSKQQAQKPIQFATVLQKISKKDLRNICQDFATFSEASYELIYKNNALQSIKHVPKNQVLPNKMNSDGEIDGYWFSLDFSQPRKYEPIFIPKWQSTEKKNGSYIKIINSYQLGKSYFTDPIYMAGLPYAELEEEIANYCINHIKNGLSFGHIFNMNSGEPASDEVRSNVKKALKREGQGSSNAGNTFINWNSSKDDGITVEALAVSDAHQQYEFLSSEATQKLLISHKVTSPILFGIKDNTGLGNNANEMETAFNELMINVIQPMQEVILDDLMDVFNAEGYSIDLDFIPLRIDNASNLNENSYNGAQISSAIEIFVNVREGVLTKEQAIVFLIQFLNINQATAESLFNTASAIKTVQPTQLSKQTQDNDPIIADWLIELGEEIDDNDWETIDSEEYCEKSVQLNETSLKLASVIDNIPLAPSSIDNDYFKVRFEYAGNLNPQREFCAKMMKAGRVYRKEDIDLASQRAVNSGFGIDGADTYDILKYKGSVNCKHYWLRKVYLKKGNNYITVENARRLISDLKNQGIDTQIPTSGEPLSTIKPNDMPNGGAYNG
jgi:hypothetical protein